MVWRRCPSRLCVLAASTDESISEAESVLGSASRRIGQILHLMGDHRQSWDIRRFLREVIHYMGGAHLTLQSFYAVGDDYCFNFPYFLISRRSAQSFSVPQRHLLGRTRYSWKRSCHHPRQILYQDFVKFRPSHHLLLSSQNPPFLPANYTSPMEMSALFSDSDE